MARISGAECVRALESAGFRVRSRQGGITTLVLGRRTVVVPEVDDVMPALLQAILRSSGLSFRQLHLALPGVHVHTRSLRGIDDDPPSPI